MREIIQLSLLSVLLLVPSLSYAQYSLLDLASNREFLEDNLNQFYLISGNSPYYIFIGKNPDFGFSQKLSRIDHHSLYFDGVLVSLPKAKSEIQEVRLSQEVLDRPYKIGDSKDLANLIKQHEWKILLETR